MLSPHINIQRASASDQGSQKSAHNRRKDQGKGNSQFSRLAQTPSQGPSTPSRSRENSQVSGNAPSAPPSPRVSGTGREDAIIIKWTEKSLDKAPELCLLSKKPSAFHAYSGDCFSKFFRLIASVCRTLNRVGDSGGLANFKPVVGRTDHTLEYVNDLAREYTINLKYGSQPHIGPSPVLIKTPSGTTIKSDHSGSKASAKSSTTVDKQKRKAQQTVKNQLLKDFYEKSYRTLTILQQCIGHFRTLVYTMTFSRYAEEDLTESEAKMVRGKSIIGSCIWIVTCALQQLQEDPQVELSENLSKLNPDLIELGSEIQSLITLSLQAWNDTLNVIGVLDRLHKRTEEVFHKQSNHFRTASKPDSEAANVSGVHMRQYRRPPQGDMEHLRTSTKGFDPYANLLTWSNKRQGPSRILYLTDYTDPDSLWLGFDPLSVDKKLPFLRDILNFIKLVLESVKETTQKILSDFQGHGHGHHQDASVHLLSANRSPNFHFTGVSCYEDGIEAMDDILTRKLQHQDFNIDEIHEFFETDKIFLDDMDVLTLSAAVFRNILFEARHTMHVCYETCRILDYKEFSNLPSFEKIYRKIKEGYEHEHPPRAHVSRFGKKDKGSFPNTNQFDFDETHVELRNVAGLFRTSQYREVLKNLPVYTNRIGITIQDPELVFTPSSEKLLS